MFKNTRTLLFLALFTSALPILAQTQTEQVLKTPSGTLYGTLTQTANTTTVALLIAGSGPTDRDGNNPLGVSAASYRLLAEGLAANGIATLRYDKRGIAKSRAALTSEENLTFENTIEDALSWVDQLRKEQHYTRVILIGHSEGALIAAIAGQDKRVNAVISLSGAGRDLSAVIMEQLRRNPNNPPFVIAQCKSILDSLTAGLRVKNVPQYFQSLFRASVQPYMISTLRHAPSAEAKKLTIPFLIVQGDADTQVTVADADALSSANPRAKKVIIPGMNHVLKTVKDAADNQQSYMDAGRPLSAQLVPDIVDFLKKL